MNASALFRSVGLLSGGVVLTVWLAVPSLAAAQTVSINTQELLPPGQNVCQQMKVASVQPYVYGGILESFDVTISDTQNSYIGLFATIGNTAISFDSITRWAGEPSGLRIHVDTPNLRVNTGLPVKLTLLASLPGQPTCMTTIMFEVNGTYVTPTSSGAGAQTSIGNRAQPSNTFPNVQNAASQTLSQVGNPTTASSSAPNATTSGGIGTSSSLAGASTATANSPSVINGICSGNNVYRLWFILLALYIVIVAVVVFLEPSFLGDSVLSSTAALLVPLIALLAFWYLSAACRGASWIPVVACVIAIIGLFLAFREYETTPLLPAPSET